MGGTACILVRSKIDTLCEHEEECDLSPQCWSCVKQHDQRESILHLEQFSSRVGASAAYPQRPADLPLVGVSTKDASTLEALEALMNSMFAISLEGPIVDFNEANTYDPELDLSLVNELDRIREKLEPEPQLQNLDIAFIVGKLAPFLSTPSAARHLQRSMDWKHDAFLAKVESLWHDSCGEQIRKEWRCRCLQLIFSYTLQSPAVFQDVSRILNDVENRMLDIKVLEDLSWWTLALDKALQALPTSLRVQKTCYRGMRYRYSDKQFEKFKVGTWVYWYVLKSVSTDESLMVQDNFCGLSGPRTLFIIHDCVGHMIQDISYFPDESEVLVRPLSVLEVKSVERREVGLVGDPHETADVIELSMKHTGLTGSDFFKGSAIPLPFKPCFGDFSGSFRLRHV